MTDLRAACIHGRYEQHMYSVDSTAMADFELTEHCPGGRDITIDHEAAAESICDYRDPEHQHHPDRPFCQTSLRMFEGGFDAAIGDTDE